MRTLAVAGLVLLGFACGTGSTNGPDEAEFRRVIAEKWTRYARALQAGDAGGVADLLTEDARVRGPEPGSQNVRGRRAFRGLVETTLSGIAVTGLQVETEELLILGDHALESGRYRERFSVEGMDAELDVSGAYMVLWKRTNGDWKIHRFIWNTHSDDGGGAVPESER